MSVKFKEVRSKALELWLSKTNRKTTNHSIVNFSESIANTFECKWQDRNEIILVCFVVLVIGQATLQIF